MNIKAPFAVVVVDDSGRKSRFARPRKVKNHRCTSVRRKAKLIRTDRSTDRLTDRLTDRFSGNSFRLPRAVHSAVWDVAGPPDKRHRRRPAFERSRVDDVLVDAGVGKTLSRRRLMLLLLLRRGSGRGGDVVVDVAADDDADVVLREKGR